PAGGRPLRSRGTAFAEKPRAGPRRAARGCLPCRRLRQKFHRLLPAHQGGRDRPLPLGGHGLGAAGIFRAVLGGKDAHPPLLGGEIHSLALTKKFWTRVTRIFHKSVFTKHAPLSTCFEAG